MVFDRMHLQRFRSGLGAVHPVNVVNRNIADRPRELVVARDGAPPLEPRIEQACLRLQLLLSPRHVES